MKLHLQCGWQLDPIHELWLAPRYQACLFCYTLLNWSEIWILILIYTSYKHTTISPYWKPTIFSTYNTSMRKGGAASFCAWFAVVMVVLLVAEVYLTAAECNFSTLSKYCANTVTGQGGNPFPLCCTELQNKDCICLYKYDPLHRRYIGTLIANNVDISCGVRINWMCQWSQLCVNFD